MQWLPWLVLFFNIFHNGYSEPSVISCFLVKSFARGTSISSDEMAVHAYLVQLVVNRQDSVACYISLAHLYTHCTSTQSTQQSNSNTNIYFMHLSREHLQIQSQELWHYIILFVPPLHLLLYNKHSLNHMSLDRYRHSLQNSLDIVHKTQTRFYRHDSYNSLDINNIVYFYKLPLVRLMNNLVTMSFI